MSFRVIPRHSVSFRVIPCHSVSFRVIPCHSVSFRVIPRHSIKYAGTYPRIAPGATGVAIRVLTLFLCCRRISL